MDPRVKLLYFVFDLILPLAVGWWCRRQGWFSERLGNRVMFANQMTLQPLLCLLSLWVVSLDRTMLWLPVLGVIMQVVPGAIGWWWMRGRLAEPLEQGSYLLACMLSNRGTVGIVSVYVVAGETGYGLSVLVMLFAQFVVQFVGFPVSAYYARQGRPAEQGREPWWRVLVNWKQLPVLGIAGGLALNWAGTPRPAWCADWFPWLVHVMSWLFILPIGYGLDFRELRHYWRRVADMLGIKFILTPLVMWLLILPLGLDRQAQLVTMILAFSPTAINAVVVAKLHDLNTHLAIAAFMLTTVIYLLIVLPLFLAWM
jgi:predicted permease